LAELIQDTKRDEALRLLWHAVWAEEKASGAEHMAVAAHLNSLARLLVKHGNFNTAEQLMRRALAIDDKAVGSQHRHVGGTSAIWEMS
jgi:two-component SAPR family response regulator